MILLSVLGLVLVFGLLLLKLLICIRYMWCDLVSVGMMLFYIVCGDDRLGMRMIGLFLLVVCMEMWFIWMRGVGVVVGIGVGLVWLGVGWSMMLSVKVMVVR